MIKTIEKLIAATLLIISYTFILFRYSRYKKFYREVYITNKDNKTIRIKYYRLFKNQQQIRLFNFFEFYVQILKNQFSITGNHSKLSITSIHTNIHSGIFGLISSQSIKKQLGMINQPPSIAQLNNRSRISIWLRYIFSSPYRIKTKKYKQNINVFNIYFFNTTKEKTIKKIEQLSNDHKKNMAFINAHCLNIANKNNQYFEFLKKSDLILPDGIGIKIYTNYIQKSKLVCNLNGTDLMPILFDLFSKKNKSVYLIGATEKNIQIAQKKLRSQYPLLKISGFSSGYKTEWVSTITEINNLKPDIIIIGMGTPIQEEWIISNKDKINYKLIIPVGGYFDFLSEKNKRADTWIREIGLEWIYRLYLEPSRLWKRYILGNFLFLYTAWHWKNRQQGK